MEGKFLEIILEGLRMRLGEGYRMEVRMIPKNNGVCLTGIAVKRKGERQPVTMCLDPYYRQYRQGGISLEEALEDICGLFSRKRCLDYPSETEEELLQDPGIWDQVVIRLVNREKNRELLEEIPHIPFLDLEIIFVLLLNQDEKGQLSTLVTREAMKHWPESLQKLLVRAKKNTVRLRPVSLISMKEALLEIAKSNLGEDYEEELVSRLLEEGEEQFPLYVLSNRQGLQGAAALLYPDVLKDFAASQGSDLMILPSSIHEVLLLPIQESLDFGWLQEMVKYINCSEVSEEDQLSDHIYIYQRKEDQIIIAR